MLEIKLDWKQIETNAQGPILGAYKTPPFKVNHSKSSFSIFACLHFPEVYIRCWMFNTACFIGPTEPVKSICSITKWQTLDDGMVSLYFLESKTVWQHVCKVVKKDSFHIWALACVLFLSFAKYTWMPNIVGAILHTGDTADWNIQGPYTCKYKSNMQ